MKTKTKEVYYCDHCKKHGFVKHMMISHEKNCSYNPENKRPCFGCLYLDKEHAMVSCDVEYFGETTREKSLLYCNKKQVFLHPPQFEDCSYEINGEENHPMPKECEFANYNAKLFD
jgi:hypothetical protein